MKKFRKSFFVLVALLVITATCSTNIFASTKTTLVDADGLEIDVAEINSASEACDTEDYILKNVNVELAGNDYIEAKDMMIVKNIIADGSLLKAGYTISDLWFKAPEAYLFLNYTYMTLYETSQDSEYYVAYVDTMRQSNATIFDYDFAYTNVNGEQITNGVIFDQETGLAYVSKYYSQENKNNLGVNNVQMELLQAVYDVNPNVTFDVVVDVAEDIEGTFATSGKATVEAVATEFGIKVALDQEALSNINSMYFKVFVNGVETHNYDYYSKQGIIVIAELPGNVTSVRVEVDSDNFGDNRKYINQNRDIGINASTQANIETIDFYGDAGEWQLSEKPTEGALLKIWNTYGCDIYYDAWHHGDTAAGNKVPGLPLYGTANWEDMCQKIYYGQQFNWNNLVNWYGWIQWNVNIKNDITATDDHGVEYTLPAGHIYLKCVHSLISLDAKNYWVQNSVYTGTGDKQEYARVFWVKVYKVTDDYLICGLLVGGDLHNQSGAALYKIAYTTGPKTGNVQITKKVEGTKLTPETTLAGVKFQLTNKETQEVFYTHGTNGSDLSTEDGICSAEELPKGMYTAKEIVYPKDVLPVDDFDIEVVANETATYERKDIKKKMKLQVNKVIVEEMREITDASISGAVFDIYSDAELTNKVGTMGPTDVAGKCVSEEYPTGTYYVKETVFPEGIDPNAKVPGENVTYKDKVYVFDLNVEEQTEPTKLKVVEVGNCPILGACEVIKMANSTSSTEKNPAAGAKLRLTLKSKPSVSYTATVDDKGKAKFINKELADLGYEYTLPYGEYVLTEDDAPGDKHYFYFIKDEVIKVTQPAKTEYRIESDDHVPMYLQIQKKDKDTGKTVAIAGAQFKIWDCANKKFVTQITYPNGAEIDTFETDATGKIITPSQLNVGEYIVYEVKAPQGYYLEKNLRIPEDSSKIGKENEGGLYVNIDKLALGLTIESQSASGVNLMYTTTASDAELKGRIDIYKKAEMLTDVKEEKITYKDEFGIDITETVYTPVYTERYLGGVTYEIFAGEEITSPDGNHKFYSKDQSIGTITTDNEGVASSKNLPLGKYYLIEKSAPEGILITSTKYEVELTNDNQLEEVKPKIVALTDIRQKLTIKIDKIFEDIEYVTSENQVNEAIFGVFAAEDIKNADGKVIIKEGQIVYISKFVENNTSNEVMDIPAAKYYVQELASTYPYTINSTQYPVDLKFYGNTEAVVEVKTDKIDNDFLKGDVAIFKYSSSSQENVVVNGNEISHDQIEMLENSLMNDIKSMTLAEAKEYVSKLKIIKAIGAEFTLYFDEECNVPVKYKANGKDVVLVIGEDGFGVASDVPVGTYYLRETKAPEGYELPEDLSQVTAKVDVAVDDLKQITYVLFDNDSVTGEFIHKTDIFTGEDVPNCEFEIAEKETGKVIMHAVTNSKGIADISLDLFKDGVEYSYTELKAPDKYQLDTNPHYFTAKFDKDGKWAVTRMEVTNVRNFTRVELIKTDDEGNRVPNCVFELKSDETGFYEKGTTDENGIYVFEEVPYGHYTYTELEAPAKYNIDTTPHEIEVYGKTMTINFVNTGDIAVYSICAVALVSALGIAFVLRKKLVK